MIVTTAVKILLVGGVANLLVGGLSGIPMGIGRQNGAATVPKYLTMVHMGSLMFGPMLLGLALAVSVSSLTPWFNTATAAVLVGSSVMLLTKDTINWRQGVTDEFAEETLGLTIGRLFGPVFLLGILGAGAATISGL